MRENSTSAGMINAENQNLTWGDLALINGERIMRLARPFAEKQTKDNLVHLKDGQVVGEWRDSEYGKPRSVCSLQRTISNSPCNRNRWRPHPIRRKHSPRPSSPTLHRRPRPKWPLPQAQAMVPPRHHVRTDLGRRDPRLLQGVDPQSKAQDLVASYKNESSFPGPDQAASITDDVVFHALSLDGYDNLAKVEVMNTDDCFRHFLLNTTNDTQLTSFLNNSATNIRRTFPAGLMTSAGMVVANPAFGGNPVYAQNWTTGAYHGTVIWSWQLAMMAKGLERQLGRCQLTTNFSVSHGHRQQKQGSSVAAIPAFCADDSVYGNVKAAYNELWNTIEQNESQLSGEVWSWVYRDGGFQVTPLGVLPAPGGGSQTGMSFAFPSSPLSFWLLPCVWGLVLI